ncbi:lytic transglycosylase domain-containing protein [Phenylobacterium sp.]|uniref:lytic transglycosylase domain-containing protein n=1 Tax=Phenylobacterium sp. TaxID=1871053 RepID=UPI0030F3E2CA
MILPLPLFLGLAATCAPHVAPETLTAIVQVESGFDALALGVNGTPRVHVRARSLQEAATLAREFIKQGRSVDLGLGQINSANLHRLGLTVEAAFDPCLNLSAAGRILAEAYAQARLRHADEQTGLRAALSIYNTGDDTRGLRNGYVAKVLGAAPQAAEGLLSEGASIPSWDVFNRAPEPTSFVITVPTPPVSVAGEHP